MIQRIKTLLLLYCVNSQDGRMEIAMKKKIVLSFVVIMLIIVANIIVYVKLNSEDSIIKDRLFIYEGSSYYAVDDESMLNISFILVDSKRTITEDNKENVAGVLYGDTGKENELSNISIDLLNKYKNYSVYSVSGTVEFDDLEESESMYTHLCVKDQFHSILFDLPIGKLLIEKIEETNANKNVVIGYAVNEDVNNQYLLSINNDTNDILTVDDVSFKLDKKRKVFGKWLDEKNYVEGNKQEEDIWYIFEAGEDIIYIQPVVYYNVGGESYSEIAKIATCYVPTLGKQEIIDYIRENIDGQ